jgi:uncharacterized protein (TIGR02246 family)
MTGSRAVVIGIVGAMGAWVGPASGAVPTSRHVPEVKRAILITVDDLPIVPASLHPDAEEQDTVMGAWLDAFDKHGVKAVGLVRGDGVAGRERLLKRWLERGHQLGNHSWSHPSYSGMEAEAYRADMERGRAVVAKLTGGAVRWFRFPYLREGDSAAKLTAMRAWLAETGQRNLPVTIDTSDWSFAERWTELRRASERADAGKGRNATIAQRDVLGEDYLAHLRLMVRHYERLGDEVMGRDAANPTPQVILLHLNEVGAVHIDEFLEWLTATGHRFAMADEVMADPALQQAHNYTAPYGVSYWWRVGVQQDQAKQEAAIRQVMADSVAAWNRGDLDTFAAPYTDDARFISSAGVTEGKAAILERYKKRYPGRKGMGRLTLDVTRITLPAGQRVTVYGAVEPILPFTATLIARWKVDREGETLEGSTLVVFEKHRGKWLITEDHSS